jgi:hypothetical protein
MKNLFSTLAIAAISIIILFTVSQCKKEAKDYTITGRLVDSCTGGNPLGGFSVRLYDVQKASFLRTCTDNIDQRITTDSTGKFRFSYSTSCLSEPLQIDVSDSKGKTLFVGNITTNKNIDLGDIVPGNNGNYVLKIATDTAYSIADTLFYNIMPRLSGLDSTYKFITGPFANNQLVDSFPVSLGYDAGDLSNSFNIMNIIWILKSSGKVYKPNTTNPNPHNFIMSPCANNEAVLQIGK